MPLPAAANDDDLGKLLEEVLGADTAKAWFDALDVAGVPVEISRPDFVSARADEPFLTFSMTPASVPGEAPGVGEHTDDVLAELDLAAGVVAAIHEECASRSRG